jgi:hypothetical protein
MEAMMVVRGMTPAHRRLRSRLGALLMATVALDAAASLIVYVFERHARGTAIHTLGDALFWTSTQLTTVSSQLPNPISTPVRVLDVLLQAYAICLAAILAGSFGAFFHGRSMASRDSGTRAPTGQSSPSSRARATASSRPPAPSLR